VSVQELPARGNFGELHLVVLEQVRNLSKVLVKVT